MSKGRAERPLPLWKWSEVQALPLDLLKSEQDRINAETLRVEEELEASTATLHQCKELIKTALRLMDDVHRSYVHADEEGASATKAPSSRSSS